MVGISSSGSAGNPHYTARVLIAGGVAGVVVLVLFRLLSERLLGGYEQVQFSSKYIQSRGSGMFSVAESTLVIVDNRGRAELRFDVRVPQGRFAWFGEGGIVPARAQAEEFLVFFFSGPCELLFPSSARAKVGRQDMRVCLMSLKDSYAAYRWDWSRRNRIFVSGLTPDQYSRRRDYMLSGYGELLNLEVNRGEFVFFDSETDQQNRVATFDVHRSYVVDSNGGRYTVGNGPMRTGREVDRYVENWPAINALTSAALRGFAQIGYPVPADGLLQAQALAKNVAVGGWLSIRVLSPKE